ncbi:hypothetical protein ACIREM_32855 [Streptomyces shenzhenensis]|uniref:hypothetical protein n=1 Tax=Streptomyces shenzhenensis TaxID=943815 RepID=UPI00380DCD83
MTETRHTAGSITDDALDVLYENANRGWRRGDRWKRRAKQAAAAIGRARSLHVKYDDSDHCQHDGEPWPCPTLRALDNPEEGTTP